MVQDFNILGSVHILISSITTQLMMIGEWFEVHNGYELINDTFGPLPKLITKLVRALLSHELSRYNYRSDILKVCCIVIVQLGKQ